MKYEATTYNAKTNYCSAKAETRIIVKNDEATGKSQVVKITTSKGRYRDANGMPCEGLVTSAHMIEVEKKNGYAMESTLIFGNGHCNIQGVACKRVTEKAVKEAHESALAKWSASEIVNTVIGRIPQAA